MNRDDMYVPDLEDLKNFVGLPDKQEESSACSSEDDIYQKNIKALRRHHPEVADILEDITVDEKRIRIVDSESGAPRIIYRKDDGEEINVHSSDNPAECANQAVDLLGQIDKEGIITLFGFGLGYFAEEVFERFEKGHILLVYEAVPEVFKAALQTKDFTTLINSEKVKIVLGADADNFSVIHDYHHHITNGKLWVVEHKPSVKLNRRAYENFLKRLNEEKSLSEVGVSTNIRRGREFMDACFANLHSIIRKPGVKELKNIFPGCAAIVVSAGPSLDRNIHLLKRAKGRAVIIATGGALPTLISCNVAPDLVVEIDPVAENIEDKFQENPELKNVPFICLAQYTPGLVDIYPGPLFINGVSSNVAYVWLSKYWEDKGIIECFGGSVAHLAYATAEYIGAKVIAFVGQDLSYKSNRMHTAGYSDDLDRRLAEASEKREQNALNGIPVKDIFGEDTFTIAQFLAFKISFESRIRGSDIVVINATEGGLPLEGATNMRLADFIDEHCNGNDETDTFPVLSGLLNTGMKYDLEGLIEELSYTRKTYEKIKKASKLILKYTKRLQKIKGKENRETPELNNILEKVQTLIETVRHPSLNILSGYNYGLELYMKKQEIQDIDEIEDKWEMLDRQLERGRLYYNEIVKTISRFNRQMDKTVAALQREKKIDSVLGNRGLDETQKFYQAGMMYKEAGIATQAVRYLEPLVKDGDENGWEKMNGGHPSGFNELCVQLADVYISQYRFNEAKDLLGKIEHRTVERDAAKSKSLERVTGMIKTCDQKIRAWEGRKKMMGGLLEDAEAKYGSHLESGYFYFRAGDFERAEKSYIKAIESNDPEGLTEAYYGLAHAYLQRDDHEAAVNVLEKAIETDPTNPMPYRDLGLIAIQNNNIEPAEAFLSKAIELAPSEAELYKPLASLYMGVGEREKAVALYENAIRQNGGNPVMRRELAAIYKETISEAEAG